MAVNSARELKAQLKQAQLKQAREEQAREEQNLEEQAREEEEARQERAREDKAREEKARETNELGKELQERKKNVLDQLGVKHTAIARLKPIWKSAKDPASGRLYFYNPLTKQTTWTDPKLKFVPQEKPDEDSIPTVDQPVVKSSRPTEKECLDEQTHRSDKMNQLDVRADDLESIMEKPMPDKPQWASANVVQNGKKMKYYYNRLTRSSTWNKPELYDTDVSAYRDAMKNYRRCLAAKKESELARWREREEDSLVLDRTIQVAEELEPVKEPKPVKKHVEDAANVVQKNSPVKKSNPLGVLLKTRNKLKKSLKTAKQEDAENIANAKRSKNEGTSFLKRIERLKELVESPDNTKTH
jgi:hypothetical protein